MVLSLELKATPWEAGPVHDLLLCGLHTAGSHKRRWGCSPQRAQLTKPFFWGRSSQGWVRGVSLLKLSVQRGLLGGIYRMVTDRPAGTNHLSLEQQKDKQKHHYINNTIWIFGLTNKETGVWSHLPGTLVAVCWCLSLVGPGQDKSMGGAGRVAWPDAGFTSWFE